MAHLDLDDLPPKIADLLSTLGDGEELLLVQHGAVEGWLTASISPELIAPEPEAPPEQQMREVFETFRPAIADEFQGRVDRSRHWRPAEPWPGSACRPRAGGRFRAPAERITELGTAGYRRRLSQSRRRGESHGTAPKGCP